MPLLFATPIHTRVGTAGIFCVTASQLALSDQEAQDIAEVIHASLPKGCRLNEYDDQQWRCVVPNKLQLRTTPASKIEGQELRPFVPKGKDASQWKAIVAEVEMALHDHPVNQQRRARNQPTIDSLWLWQPSFWQRLRGQR